MPLGRLERVDLRTEWTSEPGHFTPWLAQEENLRLLAETIGVDLALEGTEQNVGPFRADILCKAEGNSDHWVLIENQLERTDHIHLGQLITYAAGLHTATIVWIAQRVTDEHRAALDWLNEVTIPEISFFGLEVELWRIGDSLAAPKFNILSQPNGWVKQKQAERNDSSPLADFYYRYWQSLSDRIRDRRSSLKPNKPNNGSWTNFAFPIKGFALGANASTRDKWSSVSLYIFNDPNKQIIHGLAEHRQALELQIPDIIFSEKPGRKASAIELYNRSANPVDEIDWAAQQDWMIENLERMSAAILPFIGSVR